MVMLSKAPPTSRCIENYRIVAKLLHCVRTAWALHVHCVGTACALHAPAGKLTQDHLPRVC